MTSRLRGSAKEEPKPTSLLSSKSRTYFSSGWEPKEKAGFDGSRNKVSRKDSRGKYDGFPERSEAKYDKETNGYASPPDDDEDPDLLYKRSRDHFGTWNIHDIIGERDVGPKVDRKSRLDLFKSNGVEQKERKKLSNGKSRVKHSSPDLDDAGDDHHVERKWRGKSRSPDLERDRHKLNKTNNLRDNPRPRRERSSINSPDRQDDRVGGHRPSHRALLREIENLGTSRGGESPERSTERRYGGNPSPENRDNDKIRQLINRFKTNEIQEPLWAGRKSEQGQRSPIGRENGAKLYQAKVRSSSRERHDEWQNGDKYEDEQVEVPSFRSPERRSGTNGDYRESNDAGFRKRSDTYSLERSGRQRAREQDEKPKESSGKRRSHVYSGSPEKFDVQIQRYERALPGPRKDPELGRKNSHSGREREPEVRRRSSLKVRDELTQSQERNGRHMRPLTPPDDRDLKFEDERRSATCNAKDWYESNKQFGVKYLQENSKLRSPDRVNYDQHEEEYVRRNRSPIKETYSFGEGRVGDQSEDDQFRERFASPPRMEAVESTHERGRGELRTSRKSTRSTVEVDRGLQHQNGRRNEPVTIRIRNPSEDHYSNEGRSKRGALFTEETNNGIRNNRRNDNENHSPKRGDMDRLDWTSASTPARKMWSYREGGAQITDIDKGQPCLKCEDACSGFLQHTWR
nr:uncharacterized protein LOC124224672 isoform X2 [Neodiprion pinetum]